MGPLLIWKRGKFEFPLGLCLCQSWWRKHPTNKANSKYTTMCSVCRGGGMGWRLVNCPAVFLSYFHCGFVMKYSWQIQRSKWAIQVGWVGQWVEVKSELVNWENTKVSTLFVNPGAQQVWFGEGHYIFWAPYKTYKGAKRGRWNSTVEYESEHPLIQKSN